MFNNRRTVETIQKTYSDSLIQGAVNHVFNCCPTVTRQDLLNHSTVVEVGKEEIMIHSGEKCNGIYIVASGSMKLYLEKNGRQQIFLFKTVNDLIGIQPAMQHANFIYSACAMEDSVLVFIPQDQVEKLIHTYPNAFFSLMKKVNETAAALEARTALMMTDSAETVVIRTFQNLRDMFGSDKDGFINIHIPVKDLASYICMSKTNLYRVLQHLKEKKLITHRIDRYKLEKA